MVYSNFLCNINNYMIGYYICSVCSMCSTIKTIFSFSSMIHDIGFTIIRHILTLFYSDVMLKGNPGHVIARNAEGCARLTDL